MARAWDPARGTVTLPRSKPNPRLPAQFSQSLMCSMRRTKLRFCPEALSWRTARQRPAILRSSCVPACRRRVLSNRALTPLRARRRGVPIFEMLRQRRDEPRVFLYAFELLATQWMGPPPRADPRRQGLSQHLDVQNDSIVRVQARLQARPGGNVASGATSPAGRTIGSR